jgi:hypothetical protein
LTTLWLRVEVAAVWTWVVEAVQEASVLEHPLVFLLELSTPLRWEAEVQALHPIPTREAKAEIRFFPPLHQLEAVAESHDHPAQAIRLVDQAAAGRSIIRPLEQATLRPLLLRRVTMVEPQQPMDAEVVAVLVQQVVTEPHKHLGATVVREPPRPFQAPL